MPDAQREIAVPGPSFIRERRASNWPYKRGCLPHSIGSVCAHNTSNASRSLSTFVPHPSHFQVPTVPSHVAKVVDWSTINLGRWKPRRTHRHAITEDEHQSEQQLQDQSRQQSSPQQAITAHATPPAATSAAAAPAAPTSPQVEQSAVSTASALIHPPSASALPQPASALASSASVQALCSPVYNLPMPPDERPTKHLRQALDNMF